MCLTSDFCNRINQACNVRLRKVLIKNNRIVCKSNFLLYKMGYLLCFVLKNYKFIVSFMKYSFYGSVIRGLISMSKRSLKYYLKCKHIFKFAFNNFFGMLGFMAISTNKGKIILDFDCMLNSIGGKPL